ncbi:hypothetical protein CPB85DRAFT_1311095 [Mucidula mucida]|nr:hypothetical protein CPB85DRAFT_1311095 [Mucidula mucida]
MSVYYYEPFYNFDHFFENLAGRPSSTDVQLPAAENTMPVVVVPSTMDLHKDAGKNTVTATFELPGLKKEDTSHHLGETKLSMEHEEGGYAVRKRRLPQGVKEEEIKASLADGILTVTFPKAGVDTAPKRISIV